MRDLSACSQPLLSVRNLTVRPGRVLRPVVKDLSFDIAPGEMLALVGESGSGKTMAARSVLRLLPAPLKPVEGSSIQLKGTELLSLSDREMCKVRGARVGMVFQEPMVSLNPAMQIGKQMAEALRLHHRLSAAEIRDRSLAMLERIRIPDPAKCLQAWPHEFSGGMRQRIMLASVMLLRPELLIADEPTTALDTLVQRDVLDLMVELTQEQGTGVLLISHDLGMVANYAPKVVVMQGGVAVEQGESGRVLTSPRHSYTKSLIDALPRRSEGGGRDMSIRPTLLELEGVIIDYPGRERMFRRDPAKRAVHGVDLSIGTGETLALVGGSGSGKTTLGRAIVGLVRPTAGAIRFKGHDILQPGPKTAGLRREMQIVFQDPYSSLDPRQRVDSVVGEPLLLDHQLSPKDRKDRVRQVFEEVGLPWELAERLPHQLSGGQRQRVAIARAIVRNPAFVVADEPVSALDMTVQKQILRLIRNLQDKHGFACLFVSHDLAAVEQVADRVAVMEHGRIVELGHRDAIFDAPQHPYTRQLLNAAMLIDRRFGASLPV